MLQLRKILVADDFSPSSDQALRYAADLAGNLGAGLHVLHVEVLFGGSSASSSDRKVMKNKLQERLLGVAPGVDLDRCSFVVSRNLEPATEILDYAEAEGVDVIAVGTHGRRGLRHLLLGSVAEEVVRLASCPVLTVRAAGKGTPLYGGAILVPVDFSRHAREALRVARALAVQFGAHLELMHVVEESLHPAFYNTGVFSIYDIQPDIEEQVLAQLKALHESTEGPDVPVTYRVGPGHAAQEIVRRAEEGGHSLIVMATHGLRGLEHVMVGSVTERVVRAAPCPVFTVKSFGKSLLAPEERQEKASAS